MRAVVIYESMFGNTRSVAEAVAEGLSTAMETLVVRASDASPQILDGVSLLCVGAPTHAHGLPRPSTRRGAPDYVRKSAGGLELQPGADAATGVREWLDTLGHLRVEAGAFDTKASGPGFLTGRASRGIARRLKAHGASVAVPPESFVVKANRLVPGELERAVRWGQRLATTRTPRSSPATAR